jgi:hypothetical protein
MSSIASITRACGGVGEGAGKTEDQGVRGQIFGLQSEKYNSASKVEILIFIDRDSRANVLQQDNPEDRDIPIRCIDLVQGCLIQKGHASRSSASKALRVALGFRYGTNAKCHCL